LSTSLIGRKLGKYQITELVGHGGMATVYKGYQADVDRHVAVKVLPPHPGQSAAFVDRFRQEARTIARLQHPHILPLYDYGDENDVLYLVTPFIDGGSLSDKIRQGAMALPDVQRILSQVGSALDFAHKQGIIHRDIKPDNILINKEGFALLSDFGIAKLLEGSSLTTTGGLVGTPAYIAPEQAQNSPLDGRADIYSLGIVVYEMLAGKQPYKSETPVQVILQHITAPTPRVSEAVPNLPPLLDTVMDTALAKEPADRYATAGAFAEDFKRAIKGQELAPKSESTNPAAQTAAAMDLSSVAKPINPTARLNPTTPGELLSTNAPGTTTILTTSNTNPLILIAGFGIIAVLLVVVLVVLLSQQNATGVTPTPTQAVIVPTNEIIATDTRSAVESTAPPTLVALNPGRETFGAVTYTTTEVIGDTARLQVSDLPAAGAGRQYVAWLVNTRSGNVLRMPNFTVDALGSGLLTYTGEQSLIYEYNRVILTRETEVGETPGDDVIYAGEIPIEVSDALFEILIASYAGLPLSGSAEGDLGTSLLEAVLAEGEVGRSHVGLAASATSAGGLHTHAEHTMNILLGTEDDYDGNGRGDNPGRGFGIAHFLDEIEGRLTGAADVASPRVQGQIELIRVCIDNARQWTDQIVELARDMTTAPDIESVAAQRTEATALAEALISGVDLNENGIIEPFEGECGLEQISAFGVSVANLELFGE
jgi:serine/threonine protein kinase